MRSRDVKAEALATPAEATFHPMPPAGRTAPAARPAPAMAPADDGATESPAVQSPDMAAQPGMTRADTTRADMAQADMAQADMAQAAPASETITPDTPAPATAAPDRAAPDTAAPGITAPGNFAEAIGGLAEAGTEANPDETPAVLADLIAAGLVSHEMIGDPDRLGGETAALKALCAIVTGPVWRIGAYHYAFRAGTRDLAGRLGAMAPGDWTGAITAALTESLGPDAVWLNPTDLLPEAGAQLEQPLLFLRAQAAAVADGLSTAGPEVAAVISARYAAEVARLSTGIRSPLAAHVEALGARLETMGATLGGGMGALLATPAANPDQLTRLVAAAVTEAVTEALAPATARLEARIAEQMGEIARQSAALQAQAARLEALGRMMETGLSGLERIATRIAATDGFQETLGLGLAEVIARLDQRASRSDGLNGHPAGLPRPAQLS